MELPKGILAQLLPKGFCLPIKERTSLPCLNFWEIMTLVDLQRQWLSLNISKLLLIEVFLIFLYKLTLMISNCIHGNNQIPWILDRILQEVIQLVHRFHVEVLHIFRKANIVANALASYDCETTSFHIFYALSYLPHSI